MKNYVEIPIFQGKIYMKEKLVLFQSHF